MAATLTAYNDALKRIWTQEQLEEQIYQDTPLLSKIEKLTRHKVGEVARVPLHVSRNGGYTALPAGGGNLNTAGNQGISKAQYNYTNHHQQIAIQGDAIDGTSSNALSVAEVIDTEVKGALTDLKRQLQRQLFLNGDALIAQCRASDSNNVDLNTTSGRNAIDRGWLFVGQPVDVGTTGTEDSIVNGSTITAVDSSLYAFTVAAGNITTETTSEYVSQKDARDGTTSYEMNGLQNLVDTGSDFAGLTVAGEPTWAAAGEDSTSQALTLSLMLQQDQKIHQKTGSKADFVVTGLKQERKFYELLQQQVRYSSDSGLNAGNQENVKWKGMEFICDPDCQDEYMYFGKLKHLFIVAVDKPYWQNKITGGEILSWVQGTDSYGAKLSYRIQLATNRRGSFTKLSGLT
jgi:hypothetical protein